MIRDASGVFIATLQAAQTVIDAQRNEFYHAVYELSDTTFIETEALHLTSAVSVVTRAEKGEHIVGPDAHHFANGRTVFPEATMIARLTLRRADYITAAQLEPIYLRETTFVKAPPPRVIPFA